MLKTTVSALVALVPALAALPLSAQAPTPPGATYVAPDPKPAEAAAPSAKTDEGPLASLAWLGGCWSGNVNQRDYREHWMPLSGDRLIGASHETLSGKTFDFEYLRMEPRSDGVYYVILPSGKPETMAFKLTETKTDGTSTLFIFSDPRREFPQRIIYRRGTLGWLYVSVEGKVGGEERKVLYPMRRVDCQTGELITK